jgi:hypothetical protein
LPRMLMLSSSSRILHLVEVPLDQWFSIVDEFC